MNDRPSPFSSMRSAFTGEDPASVQAEIDRNVTRAIRVSRWRHINRMLLELGATVAVLTGIITFVFGALWFIVTVIW